LEALQFSNPASDRDGVNIEDLTDDPGPISEAGSLAVAFAQAEAAKVLGIDQPSVSDLLRGRLRGFSSDRLFRFLNALGRDIEIVIRPRGRSSSKPAIRVVRRRAAG
jgi:hypothetical protein